MPHRLEATAGDPQCHKQTPPRQSMRNPAQDLLFGKLLAAARVPEMITDTITTVPEQRPDQHPQASLENSLPMAMLRMTGQAWSTRAPCLPAMFLSLQAQHHTASRHHNCLLLRHPGQPQEEVPQCQRAQAARMRQRFRHGVLGRTIPVDNPSPYLHMDST
mmetsp:Transcript_41922/g.96197  ORF Transcript_41922/g.96197 Transcript_41922/m.96197 type:complete len:161 (-) Transcript_41922:578-1060(-)